MNGYEHYQFKTFNRVKSSVTYAAGVWRNSQGQSPLLPVLPAALVSLFHLAERLSYRQECPSLSFGSIQCKL
jgi:hypothetical protein